MMTTRVPQPRAFAAMAANRAREQDSKQTATSMEASRDMAVRVVELTEQVAELLDRVAALEARV